MCIAGAMFLVWSLPLGDLEGVVGALDYRLLLGLSGGVCMIAMMLYARSLAANTVATIELEDRGSATLILVNRQKFERVDLDLLARSKPQKPFLDLSPLNPSDKILAVLIDGHRVYFARLALKEVRRLSGLPID